MKALDTTPREHDASDDAEVLVGEHAVGLYAADLALPECELEGEHQQVG
jgi:hypothetical protein